MFATFKPKRKLRQALLFVFIGISAICAVPVLSLAAGDNSDYSNQNIAIVKEKSYFWSGDWLLTVGAEFFDGPNYVGDSRTALQWAPIFSIDRKEGLDSFSSLNDNLSFEFIAIGPINVGVVGKLILKRDSSTSPDVKGMQAVKLGAEAGFFADFYPVDWLRAHVELRHGIRSHHGIVADIAIDSFYDITPTVRLSAGPRMLVGSKDYYKVLYGVDTSHAFSTGLSPYDPKGGVGVVGFGGAITWQTTDKIITSIFSEYHRLTGPTAASSLVKQRGSKNQFTIGVSASYQFDFRID